MRPADALATIRAIADSAEGFQAPEGETLEYEFVGYPSVVTSRETLVGHGYLDPTSLVSLNNFYERLRMIGDLQVFGDRTEAASGLITHTSKIGRVPQRFTSAEATQPQSLADWMVVAYSGGFVAFIDVDENAGYTTDTIQDFGPVVGMRTQIAAWFANQPGDAAVGDDLTTADMGGGRTYRVQVNGVFHTFDVTSVDFDVSSAGVRRVVVDFDYVSVPSNAADMPAFLRGQTPAIPRLTNGMAAPQGNILVPHNAAKLVLPNGMEIVPYEGGVAVHKDGTYHSLIGDNPKVVEWEETETSTHEHDNGDDTIQAYDRWIPTAPEDEVVHLHDGTTAQVNLLSAASRFHEPTRYAAPGTAVRKIVHNRRGAANGPWILKDWSGNELTRLRPDQRATFLLMADRRGGGEIYGESIPEKVIQHTDGLIGALGASNYFNFSPTHWGRPWPAPVGADAYDLIDRDAFLIPETQHSDGASWSAQTDWMIRGAIVVRLPGFLDFYQVMNLESTTNGVLAANHFTRLFLIRGTATPTIIGVDHAYEEVNGAGDPGTYWASAHNLRVQAGDILLPMFAYPKVASMNAATINVTGFERDLALRPLVEADYARVAT